MDYVLWEISHANLIMLMATIPKYGKDKDKVPVKDLDGLDELENLIKFE